jgi:uncharacterized membrane protein
MAFCANCGNQIDEGVKFCPSCGTAVKGGSKGGSPVVEQKASPEDAEQNKGMAVVAYLLFFVPLLTGDCKKSPFVKFHTNQGTVLAIAAAGVWIVWTILWAILSAILRSLFSMSVSAIYTGYRAAIAMTRIASIVTPVLIVLILALLIIGIINAVNGKMKPLPVIGRFTIIK